MTRSIRPTAGNVLIDAKDNNPETFLYLPDIAKKRDMPQEGVVFAIGGSPMNKKGIVFKPDFKVGDNVLFRKFSGLWVEFAGKKLIQIKQKDVEAVIG